MSIYQKPRHEKQYSDLTDYQKTILDLRSKGMKSTQAISEEVGCSQPYVTMVLNDYERFIPTPDYKAETKQVAADGGQVEPQSESESSEASVTVTIQCDCGESHEVSIE